MIQGRKNGQLVVPGDKLGVIEEFMPGKGTYVEDGVIYAQNIGHALIDGESKKISVLPKTKTPITPKKGLTVIGVVQQTQDKVASVRILRIGKTDLKKPYSAILHVSYISRHFIKTIHDAFRPGDIIVAKVLGDENQPFQLTTSERELGVILAYCSKCGGTMILDKKQLKCSRCGNVERRKLSENYGSEVI
jgi:exosome complex component CSL4